MNVFTVPMKLLTAVVLDEATAKVKQELLRLGVLDFIQVSRLAPEEASRFTDPVEKENPQEYADLRYRVETLFMQAGIPTPSTEKLDPSSMQSLSLPQARNLVDAVVNDLAVIREKQKQISQSRIRAEELLRYVKESKLQYIDVRIGQIGTASIDVLRSRLANNAFILLQPESWQDIILLTLKRDRQQVTPIMDTLQWTENPDGNLQAQALEKLTAHLTAQLESLAKENDEIKTTITTRIKNDLPALQQLWSDLRLHELVGQIASNFSHTRNTTIFSGWVPAADADSLEKAIRTASNGTCVIEWIEAKNMPREEIPVAVKDSPLLRPFQKLVDNYGVPEYGSINPTPFVAVAYLAMFGLMFADAGQGLVILLVGLLGHLYYKKRPHLSGGLINPGLYQLFMYLGSASIVSGILFGSYFGYPLFPPLWFNYHAVVEGHASGGRTIYSILKITIWFGIIVIGLGLVLNWINLIRKRDWFHLVMDKNGILGGWLFGCGVWAAFAFVGSGYKQLPQGLFLPLSFGIPLAILLAKIPVHRLTLKRAGETPEEKSIATLILDIILEWIVDILEIFAGFLANTLSFMRVAGLGIAHVSLMIAFALMADLAGGGIGGLIILILGNAMIIALEGLSAGIQALRLNYYEFFTKYFTGQGLSYNPVALRSHTGRQRYSQ